MHPYITKLIADQRAADMRAAAAVHRLARAATVGVGGSRRPYAATQRSTVPAQQSTVPAQHSTVPAPGRPPAAGRVGSPPARAAAAGMSRADDRDAELCTTAAR